MTEASQEELKALASFVHHVRLAAKVDPKCQVQHLFACACLGPLPECRCMKRSRLINEFLARMADETT